ncbi:MAG: hypothetical protein ACE5HU_09185 [Acidobacteriota bacterium]
MIETRTIGTLALETRPVSSIAAESRALAGPGLSTRRIVASSSPQATLGTFESGEMWSGTGGAGIDVALFFEGTRSFKLPNPSGHGQRTIMGTDLSNLDTFVFRTYGQLLTGLPSQNNSLDFQLRILDTSARNARYTIAGIVATDSGGVVTTVNDDWILRVPHKADFTLDAGFDWSSILRVDVDVLNDSDARPKQINVDSIVAVIGQTIDIETRHVATLALETRSS